MKQQIAARKSAFVDFVVGLTIVFVAVGGGCTTIETHSKLSAEDQTFLRETLATSSFVSCNVLPSKVSLATGIRKARLVWHERKPVLIYEGVFREAIKTIWQPLTSDFEIVDDGIVVGQKGMPAVIDFKIHDSVTNEFWTSYRFKVPRTEIWAAAVEFLDKETNAPIAKIGMPIPKGTSVQQLWIFPTKSLSSSRTPVAKKGLAHVIVRTNQVQMNSNTTETTYTWYLLDAPQRQVRKLGEFVDTATMFSSSGFYFSQLHSDPIAVGLETIEAVDGGVNEKRPQNRTRLVAMRPFTTPVHKSILFEANSTIDSLVSYSFGASANLVSMAWVREPNSSSATPQIEWVSTALQLGPDKNRENLANKIHRTNLGYFPAKLDFMVVPARESGKRELALTWWGGTDNNHALVLTKMNNANANSNLGKEITKAFFSTYDLGTPVGVGAPLPDSSPANRLTLIFSSAEPQGNVPHKPELTFCTVAPSYFGE